MTQQSTVPSSATNQNEVTPHSMLGLQTFEQVLSKLLNDLIQISQQHKFTVPADQAQLIPARLKFGFSYFEPALKNLFTWLYQSKEDQNFTYDLTDQNKEYLALFISAISAVSVAQARSYIEELNNDKALSDHVKAESIRQRDGSIDSDARYGRRLGWYAFVRATKPKLVVETGIDKGLGSCVLTSALLRNQAEGFPGYYLGTDINPNAGYLFKGIYRSVGSILYGDSIASLQQLDQPIDLFINDSDHSADYERREYETIKDKLSENAIVIADNAHVTNCLSSFAEKNGKSFLFFIEKPKDHWYPGAGMGVMYSDTKQAKSETKIAPSITQIIETNQNVSGKPHYDIKPQRSCLFLNTYYPGFLDNHYSKNPQLMQADYDTQFNAIQSQSFGDSDFYSLGFSKAGWKSHDLVINSAPLQSAWARKHGMNAQGWELVVEQVKLLNPDVIYCQDVHFMPREVLQALRPHVKMIAAQNASPLKDMAFDCYDVMFASYPYFVKYCNERGLEAHYIPLAFDPRSLDGISLTSFAQRPIQCSFVGGLSPVHKDRYELFDNIAKQTPLQCWGYGKETLSSDSSLFARHNGEAWGKDMFRILSSSKITVNREAPRNFGNEFCDAYTTNMRLFEATGCGALLITDYKDNLNDFFEVGKEVVAYRSSDECIALIKYYLSNPEKAEAIARAGQERTLRDHSYEKRMKVVAGVLEKHLS